MPFFLVTTVRLTIYLSLLPLNTEPNIYLIGMPYVPRLEVWKGED